MSSSFQTRTAHWTYSSKSLLLIRTTDQTIDEAFDFQKNLY
ncbi:hypothetical protein MtrunA17_Chr6g0469101 [Medicago truncatula]|uniref:Uncharacterized protein n=1 Tax=Medicago truncatula TaxID=3880 RepID=A0A396HE09_MEDTR|nr:hypothetical protein MtrunA17_Chr6g0469101 [Medicago truncatula]